MTLLLIGMLLFVGVHSVSIVAPAWRDGMAARLGANAWKGLYAIVALAGLVLLFFGYAAARQAPVVLYVPPAWMRNLALLLMLPALVLLFATYLPGRISRAVKHPLLLAVKVWAAAHLLANGMLADVVLFGGLLAWAVAGRISMKRRVPRPFPRARDSAFNDWIAVGLGLLLYLAFVGGLHETLFGVSPVG